MVIWRKFCEGKVHTLELLTAADHFYGRLGAVKIFMEDLKRTFYRLNIRFYFYHQIYGYTRDWRKPGTRLKGNYNRAGYWRCGQLVTKT